MSLARWQRTIVDDAGNVLPGASVEVRDEATGNLAVLKSNRAGTAGISNPFTADEITAFAAFYVRGGRYQVVATLGAASITWNDVAIGTAAELDQEDLFTFAGMRYAFASETTSAAAAGTMRANTADLPLAATLYFAVVDENGNDHGDFLAQAGDGTSTIKGYVTIRLLTSGAELVYEITGATDDLRVSSPALQVMSVPVSYISGDATLAASDEISVEFTRAGDQGSQGIQGIQGTQGSQGVQGIQGVPGGLSGGELVLTGFQSGFALSSVHSGLNIVLNSASPFSVDFDSAADLGDEWIINVRNIGAGAVTLVPDTGGSPNDTINGASSLVLNQNEGALIWCNGTALRANPFNTAGNVASFDGRTGAVLTQADDYAEFSGPGYWNLTIAASVAGNALTIAFKDRNGSDPTATSPAVVNFRHATLANGALVTRLRTSAIGHVVSAGSTMGFVNNDSARLWVGAIDTGSTFVPAVMKCSAANVFYPFNSSDLRDTVPDVAAVNNADSAGILYTPAAATSTVTITNATPAVVSWTAHGLVANQAVVFNTTGALPTGLTAGTTYYVISAGLAAGSFRVSATQGGAAINTSSAGSGTHTASAGYYQRPFRAIGYLTYETALATAGVWSAAPDVTHMYAPGVPLPGQPIGNYSYATADTGSTTVTDATEVQSALSAAITPKSKANYVSVIWGGTVFHNVAGKVAFVRCVRNGAVQVGKGRSAYDNGALASIDVAGWGVDLPESTASVTYAVWIKADTSGADIHFPSRSGGTSDYGGEIALAELMG